MSEDKKSQLMSALLWPLDATGIVFQGIKSLGQGDTLGGAMQLLIGGSPLAMAILTGYVLRGQGQTLRWVAAYGAGAASAATSVPSQQLLDLMVKIAGPKI